MPRAHCVPIVCQAVWSAQELSMIQEAVVIDAVNPGLSSPLCFIRDDRPGANRIALNPNVAYRSVLDVEQRPLTVPDYENDSV